MDHFVTHNAHVFGSYIFFSFLSCGSVCNIIVILPVEFRSVLKDPYESVEQHKNYQCKIIIMIIFFLRFCVQGGTDLCILSSILQPLRQNPRIFNMFKLEMLSNLRKHTKYCTIFCLQTNFFVWLLSEKCRLTPDRYAYLKA